MRVILAGIFVFAGMLFLVAVIPLETLGKAWIIPLGLVMSFFLVVLCLAALFIFNLKIGKTRLLLNSSVAELEQQGLLVSTDLSAIRAFAISEYEDEGPYYFIELEDASILYLNGQYLYDYQGDDLLDDTELDGKPRQYRQFPCTTLTIRRHCKEGTALEVRCSGNLLPLEQLDFADNDYVKLFDIFGRAFPKDGQIITGWSYDALKSRLSRRSTA